MFPLSVEFHVNVGCVNDRCLYRMSDVGERGVEWGVGGGRHNLT
jgi:hypothetical protein